LTDALTLMSGMIPEERRLTYLRSLLQLDELRYALDEFCEGGTNGDLMDADRDRIADVPWITVDISAAKERGPIFDYVLRALLRRLYRLFQDGKPTMVIVDEAYILLREKPQEIEDMRRRLPKHNVSMLLCSHRLEDLDRSKAGPMLKTIQTKLFVRDEDAAHSPVYREHGLNERECLHVANLQERGELFFKTPEASRSGQIDLDAVELAICGSGMQQDRDDAIRLMNEHGPEGFPPAWLRHKNLHAEAAAVEAMQQMMENDYVEAAE
jgi:type IV secretion system protein VirB4